MKVEFKRPGELVDLSRTVKRGDILESPQDAPEELLQAYVNNGIAKTLPLLAPPKIGGESEVQETSESSPPSSKEGPGVVNELQNPEEVNDHVS